MKTIVVLRGLPASGKSTYAREMIATGRWKRVNKDDLRAMLDDSAFTKENEHMVCKLQDKIIRDSILRGYNVIVDNTNLASRTVKELHDLAQDMGDICVVEKVFYVGVEECLKRNASRTGFARIPDDAITGMNKKYKISALKDKATEYPTRPAVGAYVGKPDLPDAVMCDLDGTLAIMGDRSPFDASRCHELDKPNAAVLACLSGMYAIGTRIVFVSARSDEYRTQTEAFIDGCWHADYTLLMRQAGDVRKDSIVKKELFDKYIQHHFNPVFVLDDRNQVIDQWRSMGLSAFQVAPGAF